MTNFNYQILGAMDPQTTKAIIDQGGGALQSLVSAFTGPKPQAPVEPYVEPKKKGFPGWAWAVIGVGGAVVLGALGLLLFRKRG